MTITLDIPFVTLNEYINAERSNKHKAAHIKQVQTAYVCGEVIRLHTGIKLNGLFDVVFHWYKPNNRTDHDNIAFCKKFILDGFKMAKLIPDDSPKYIRNFKDTFEKGERDCIYCIVEMIKVY